jgi:hypothetical protein
MERAASGAALAGIEWKSAWTQNSRCVRDVAINDKCIVISLDYD